MTGHDHDHDENAPENLGPNEGLDPFFEQGPQQKGKPKSKPKRDEESPDDMLFAAPESDAEGESIANPGAQFQERGRAPWGGRGLSPDEIGIPVEGQQSHLEGDDDLGIDSEQELELVDEVDASSDEVAIDEVQAGEEELVLEDSEAVAEAAEHVENSTDDPLAGEVFVLDEGEAMAEGEELTDGGEEGGTVLAEEPLPADNYPVEDGWEPVSAAQEDPQDDVPLEGEGEAEAPVEEEDVASSGDEFTRRRQFAAVPSDGSEAPELVTAAPGPRRSWFGRAAASLAAAAVLAAAGVAVLQPKWLGLTLEPELVERVQVARPEPTPKVKPPVLPAEPKVEPKTSTEPKTVPEPKVEPKSEPQPQVEPQPVPPTPAESRPQPQPQGEMTPGDQIEPPELPRYLPAGESMWIGQFETSPPTENDWANVRPGGKAFAQLQNGNFFIGSVKGVAADALILVVKQGEVTLPRAEVTRITGLDTSDYSALQKATAGFLKLSNKNRLVGQILETVDDDHYILQMRSDRIVVPRSTVEKVVQQPGSENLRFGSTGDEEGWLREMAERQLQSERTGKVAPAVPPAQKVRDESVRPLPVQKTGRKAPTDGR